LAIALWTRSQAVMQTRTLSLAKWLLLTIGWARASSGTLCGTIRGMGRKFLVVRLDLNLIQVID
jgi:hypothetical protein